MKLQILAAAAVLLLPASAAAWTPTKEAIAEAQAGKVWFTVTPDPQGAAALSRAVVDIDAPPAVVWKVLMDCAAATRIMPSNRGCRLLDHDPGGKWNVREHIMKTPLMPKVRTVFREELDPQRRMTVTRVEGDLKVLAGEWRLEPLSGGKRTRVSQEMRMQPGFSAPGGLVRQFVRGEISAGMANLRRESEAAAKR
jgi:uncharacterized protein YndB with AHSA1/START domain